MNNSIQALLKRKRNQLSFLTEILIQFDKSTFDACTLIKSEILHLLELSALFLEAIQISYKYLIITSVFVEKYL